MDAKLLFRQAPVAQPARLVFGETEALPDATLAVDAELPGLVVEVELAAIVEAAVDCELPGLVVEVALNYDVDVARPTVGQVLTTSQAASAASAGVQDRAQSPQPRQAGLQDRASRALQAAAHVDVLQAGRLVRWLAAVRSSSASTIPAAAAARSRHAEMLRDRWRAVRTSSQAAAPVATEVKTSSQDQFRDRRRAVRTRSQNTAPRWASAQASHQVAMPTPISRRSRHQDTVPPPAGTTRTVPPMPDPCYVPNGHLLFANPPATSGFLLFRCDRHGPPAPSTVVVPIRRIYMIANTVSLVRVVDGALVPADSVQASLDFESWAWGVSASLPGHALSLVAPTSSGPVELLATINGSAIRFLVEQVGRERLWGSTSVRIQGRGRIAELDAPYAPVLSFGNTSARTAQQLMADVLTDNGIPLDWLVDWSLDDWLVPAGAWAHQGTYVSALTTIAKAAGGYLLPHATDKRFEVLHRYPEAPWAWADVTPDLVLPSAVAQRELKDWTSRPAYNRVFVQGQGQGLLGQITRDGTAGDLVAPQVVDPLMTAVEALRQRGRAELSAGGRQITVGLGLPVLPETGIILPGTFVQYEDADGTVRGLVRSTSVATGFPNVWQTIGVETHV